ncbi:hypothetical protein Q7C36_009179 [Tachysurus vachellii]|uniref:Uncharacterized protein n=1 Tax=Tachysurus vachellii TaxID=175792 RepID=A0AA88SVU0_TACVA|nr:hypothetical protein Q7C36_009179 [Tachysurus vachellii]
MDWRIAFLLIEVFIKDCVCSIELSSQNVKVKSSVLSWNHPKDYTNITYAVQYNTTLSEWHEVYRGTQHQFNFSAKADDFYGKRFRVRSERGNQTSAWVTSKLVQCVHIHTCAPLIELKVETDKVHLWMKHRDESLKKEKGGHIEFRLLYWKRNGSNNKEELWKPFVNSVHLILDDLESREEYCFQAEYWYLNKPYGQPSREICTVILETSFRRNLRVIMLGLLTIGALAFLGGCLYFVHKHHKRIKALFQPPLDIPAHYEEFFFTEFPERPATHPASQVAELCDIVALVEDVAEGEDRRANTAFSPDGLVRNENF